MKLKTPILTALAQPLTLMGASWKATIANAGLAIVAILLLGTAWLIMAVFVIFQALAIYSTYKDYHFIEVIMAVLKCKKTPMLFPQKGHRYVG